MPNWVYTTIKTSSKNEDFIKEIIEAGGICNYYMPMPEEIRNTNSPNRIISKQDYAIRDALGTTSEENKHYTEHFQTKEMVDELKAKYNAENWYEWAHMYWGTKWGDCDIQYDVVGDDLMLRFQSAWSPISSDIMGELLSKLKEADYTWEEEQGFGGQHIFEDGECISNVEWDVPNFKYHAYLETDVPSSTDGSSVYEQYVYLEEEYKNNMGTYEVGWHNSSEWYSESSLVTDKELIKKLESIKE